MKRTLAALLVGLALAAPARAARDQGNNREEEELFEAASQLFSETARDKNASIEAFDRFLRRFPQSRRGADAQFMIGEAYLETALKILRNEAEAKKTTPTRLLAPKNQAAAANLKSAREAFEAVVKNYKREKEQLGLRASAQYRMGEAAYNDKEWGKAIEAWRLVEGEFSKSYLVPESWMGIIFANLALEQFSQAEANLFLLGETYPHYLRVPEVLYVQGIISLHKGDYANAERAFKKVETPEAQFYLGKTYLLSKRPYLAAAAFERLARDYPDSILREETEFFIGDSFFLAKDFDGAITKYSRFQAKYPESQLRVSALFRIGSSHFQKGNYIEARAHFQSVIDRYSKDFFAPLAQYFIAESYLVEGQFRDAMFAYTKVITNYPETIKVSPLAHYKLAWSMFQVGDFSGAAQTCRNFLSLYPTHSLAKNVYIILGNALRSLKRPDEAVTAFQRIIDLAPTSDEAEQALFSILQTHYELKNFNSILTAYQFIFRHLPPSQSKWRPLSYIYAADAYIALNRVDEAKAIFEMILKVYPNETAALFARDGLSWSYSMLGEDSQALEERKRLSEDLRVLRSTDTAFLGSQLIIADSMYNQKQFEDAYQLYKKFRSENPKHPRRAEALYREGMSLYHLRYYTEAIAAWRELVGAHPKAPETEKAEFQIGDTLFRAQKYAEAIETYQSISGKYPGSKQLPLAYLRVPMCHFNLNDDAQTLNGALALVSKFPEAPEAVDGLDLMEAVYDRSPKSDFRKSLKAVVEAVPGTPTAGDAQFRIGRRLFELKQYDEAATEFQRFSVDYTGSKKLGKAQFLLGESYFNAGKHADSVFAFERYIENFPRDENTALALFHLASAHYGLKQYEPAIKHYVRLQDEYPDSEYGKAAQYNLALAYKAKGDLTLAKQAFARSGEMQGPGSQAGADALWELFGIQKDLKDYTGAVDTLDKILEAKATPESFQEATFRKGEVFVSMGQPDEALRTWEPLVKSSPKDNPFRLQGLINMAALREERKELDEAAPLYRDLCGTAPDAKVRSAACERAKAARSPGKAASAAADDAADGGTQVMPADEPKPKPKPAKKAAPKKGAEKPAEAPGKKPADKKGEPKEINIPGMN